MIKFIWLPVYFLISLNINPGLAQPTIKKDPVLSTIINAKDDFDRNADIGGLSAIEYSGYENIYYVVADKPPFRIYTLSIDIKGTIEYQIKDTLIFPDIKFEAEGIRVIDKLTYFFVSDEQNTNTSIYKFFEGKIQKVNAIPSLKKKMRHNSGYEGMALSADKNSLYFAIERPLKTDQRSKHNPKLQPYISIFEYDIKKDMLVNEYVYPLVNQSGDNGVSEILTINDSILLVLERAWTNNQSIVTINAVNIKAADNILDSTKKIPVNIQFLKPKVLVDFVTIEKQFSRNKSYNFEGMTLSNDKKHILFITDNNFSPKQTTYLMALEIDWKSNW